MALAAAFGSELMDIEIVGSTIRYCYRGNKRRSYEIRDVNDLDLARLRRTMRDARYSPSATVQLLTHRYKRSHFSASGKPARPCRIPEPVLLPRTMYAR